MPISGVMGRIVINGAREYSAEENASTYDRGSDRRLQKILL
jgi:hypothetical protein